MFMNWKMDFDIPASTWMHSPPRRPAVTLTFDLQNLTSRDVVSVSTSWSRDETATVRRPRDQDVETETTSLLLVVAVSSRQKITTSREADISVWSRLFAFHAQDVILPEFYKLFAQIL